MRIRLKQPSAPVSFVDSLIPSIWALYVAMISFVALYGYVGLGAYQRHVTEEKLVALDQLLALRQFTTLANSFGTRPARAKDLPEFFSPAESEASDAMIAAFKAETDGAKSSVPSKFNDTLIPASKIVLDVPMRMAVNGTCNALVAQLGPGRNFLVITVLIVGGLYEVKSEDTKLVNFRGCQPGPKSDFQALMLALDDGQYAFAVPRSLEEVFLGTRTTRIFSNFPLERPAQLSELLPTPLRPYVKLNEPFVFLHARAIEYLILSFANEQLGKHLARDRLDDAIEQLYGQKEKEAAYFGISASSTQFLRFGPFIYFMLSFELWRRVRRLPYGKLTSDKYWFAFETRDVVGTVYAYLCAGAPLVFGLVVYVVFATCQDLGLVVFGRVVTVTGLLTLTFPLALGYGWYSFDTLALTVLLFVPVQFLLLVLVARKLTSVVAANLRPRNATA